MRGRSRKMCGSRYTEKSCRYTVECVAEILMERDDQLGRFVALDRFFFRRSLVREGECAPALLARNLSRRQTVFTDDRLRRQSGILNDNAAAHFDFLDEVLVGEPTAARKCSGSLRFCN